MFLELLFPGLQSSEAVLQGLGTSLWGWLRPRYYQRLLTKTWRTTVRMSYRGQKDISRPPDISASCYGVWEWLHHEIKVASSLLGKCGICLTNRRAMNHFHGFSNFGDFNFIISWQRFLDLRPTLLRVCVKPTAGAVQYCGPLGLPQLAQLTWCSQINHVYVLSLYTPSSCTEFHWLRFHTWVQSCSYTTKHWWGILKVKKQCEDMLLAISWMV